MKTYCDSCGKMVKLSTKFILSIFGSANFTLSRDTLTDICCPKCHFLIFKSKVHKVSIKGLM